jgi:hypothetical protein
MRCGSRAIHRRRLGMCLGETGAYGVCLHGSYFYSVYVGGLLDFEMHFSNAVDTAVAGSYHAGMIRVFIIV